MDMVKIDFDIAATIYHLSMLIAGADVDWRNLWIEVIFLFYVLAMMALTVLGERYRNVVSSALIRS